MQALEVKMGEARTKLIEHLCAIRDKRAEGIFRMDKWDINEDGNLPSCDTACCMAGHLCALSPDDAWELSEGGAKDYSIGTIARSIWQRYETVPVPDFYANYTPVAQEDLTIDDAIIHLETGKWPQQNFE